MRRGQGKLIAAAIAALGLGAAVAGIHRLLHKPAPVREAHEAPPYRTTPLRIHPWRWIGALAALALLAGGYALALELREKADRRRLAISLTGGNPDLAPALMIRHGCRGCHTIPGLRGADGEVGPDLTGIARRVYIAGVLPNTPANLVAWITDPRAHSPRTAMPSTGITAQEARHIAAYLYAAR